MLFDGWSPFAAGTTASILAGSATAVGALPVLFTRDIAAKPQDVLMGFGAGVMLAATSFSLIVPAIEFTERTTGSGAAAAIIAAAGILLGGVFLRFLDIHAPHEHFIKGREGPEGPEFSRLSKVWLFIIAITLHNFPEGLAVGVGFGGGDVANGTSLAIGIGLQNLPEGLVVALALAGLRYSPLRAVAVAGATGLVEPVGGLLGAGAVTFAATVLPWALTFAAGAMLYVVSHEIIPETHRKGNEHAATAGLMVGFVVMMVLDVALG